jgi:hypothetical protein
MRWPLYLTTCFETLTWHKGAQLDKAGTANDVVVGWGGGYAKVLPESVWN